MVERRTMHIEARAIGERRFSWNRGAVVVAVAASGAALAPGCLNRSITGPDQRPIRSPKLEQLETQEVVDRVSLLLVVDDSVSMGDKQAVLGDSMLQLGLAPVHCTPPPNRDGNLRVHIAPTDGACPEGWSYGAALPSAETAAVITTSLEAAGACAASSRGGHSLPPFDLRAEPEGISEYVDTIGTVGQEGCGYEAPLEAIYRFLIDPAPPLAVEKGAIDGRPTTVRSGIDEALLEERARFLSPLSQLVIVVLSDEDDCSVVDRGDGYRIADPPGIARGSSSCAADPKGSCCRPCDTEEASPPDGCAPLAEDPTCSVTPTWNAAEDPLNLRCHEPKRRFGLELLQPVDKYVEMLRSPTLMGPSGETFENPLFSAGRTPDMVSVLLLTGAPWQLLATEASLDDPNKLEFLPHSDLEAGTAIWDQLLGEPDADIAPSDVHMQVSVEPRPGLPLPGAEWDPISGHEVVGHSDDLQHSCVFDLPEERTCSDVDPSCPCDGSQLPLCMSETGTYDSVQRRAQAYPAPRLLEWARKLGTVAHLGSICPKTAALPDEGFPTEAFGYASAFRRFTSDTVYSSINGPNCFLESLPVDADGQVRCRLVEAYSESVECAEHGQLPLEDGYTAAWLRETGEDAADWTLCAIPPFGGSKADPASDLYRCQNELHPQLSAEGYCYIDAALELGNPALVSMCIPNHQRRMRVIPTNISNPAAVRGLVCDYSDLE